VAHYLYMYTCTYITLFFSFCVFAFIALLFACVAVFNGLKNRSIKKYINVYKSWKGKGEEESKRRGLFTCCDFYGISEALNSNSASNEWVTIKYM